MLNFLDPNETIPLPAIIFLCTLVVVLIVLVIVYFVVLKSGKCCNPSSDGAEEGEDIGLIPAEGGAATGDGEQPKSNGDIEEGGGGVAAKEDGAAPIDGGEAATTDTAAAGGEDLVDALPEPTDSLPPAGASISGTPLTTKPPPQTESHMPKEEAGSAAAAGSVAGGSAAQDVGFIEVEEKEQVCLAGKLLLSFTYMPAANKVNLKVIRTADLPSVERGGSENVIIHLCVLPQRKQRFRTKVQPTSQGVFNQVFQFEHMTKDLLEKCAIRLRVYGVQRFSKKLMGEVKIPLIKIDLTSPLADGDIWMNLAPKGIVAQILNIDEEDAPDDIDDWALE